MSRELKSPRCPFCMEKSKGLSPAVEKHASMNLKEKVLDFLIYECPQCTYIKRITVK